MKIKAKKLLFNTIALLSATILFAQNYSFKNYNWDEKITSLEIPENYKNQNEVILDKTIKIEIVVEGNKAIQYYLLHEKTYINADDAIERNNKIYVPFYENETVVTNKVRVILKNGKIITLDKNDIKEEIDEEKQMKYNYFAINGLEKGAVIERILLLEEAPDLKGKTLFLQEEYPIVNLNFELIFPSHLSFKTKSYNGLSEAKSGAEEDKEKTILTISEKDIIGIADDEKFSNWNSKLKMFRYKLDENYKSGAKNLNNYKEFSTNIYERFHPEYDKKELKDIAEFCKQIQKSTDLQEQIWNIENKIKKTITYDRYVDSKENISAILKAKQANQTDVLKLYIAILKNFEIENNIVLTSSRFKIPFDSDFESYENLNDILLYFPNIKKYLTPTEIDYRIPLYPDFLGNNNGLFIKEKIFSGIAMGIGEVKFIEIPGVDITHDEMDILIDFSKDIENPTITNKISFGGYTALNFQPIKDFVSAEQYKTILKSIAENYTIDTEYKTLNTKFDGTENIGKNPYILEVTFDGKELIQKAGENYLFSVGQIIGKQTELYQENKRTLPVEINYPHAYLRKIKILLPKGVTVKNLEKLNMDKKTVIKDKTEAAFISTYTYSNNEINIENSEFYNIINYPIEKFEDYKAVINAAADFNKLVIILNKN